jgi:hypothetical protein
MNNDGPAGRGSAPHRPEGPGRGGPGGEGVPRSTEEVGRGGAAVDPETQRRVSLAVRAGEAVSDPVDAPAAVELARLAQRRLEDRALPNALRISGGVVLVWLVLVALPATISTGLHLAAIAAGLGIGLLLFSVIVLLGRRQLRLARQAEQRNLRLLEDGHP